MSKNRKKIGVAIDKKIDEKLKKNCYNKSKLINSLLLDWLNSAGKDRKKFQKNGD
jgi:hypothetical protein